MTDGREEVTEQKWWVAHVLTAREAYAEQHLRRQGFDVFVPRYSKTVRHARQFRHVLAPLFPGYLFVRAGAAMRWRSINGTRGVRQLVMVGDRPAELPADFVDELARGLAAAPEPGSQIEVTGGPLAGSVGQLLALEPGERVKVLLSLLGGEVVVTMPRAEIKQAL
jgi:transcription antitermination factor NusG